MSVNGFIKPLCCGWFLVQSQNVGVYLSIVLHVCMYMYVLLINIYVRKLEGRVCKIGWLYQSGSFNSSKWPITVTILVFLWRLYVFVLLFTSSFPGERKGAIYMDQLLHFRCLFANNFLFLSNYYLNSSLRNFYIWKPKICSAWIITQFLIFFHYHSTVMTGNAFQQGTHISSEYWLNQEPQYTLVFSFFVRNIKRDTVSILLGCFSVQTRLAYWY